MPQTLQFVLDNLGTPPPEVALDWARQVIEIASQSSSDESSDQSDTSTHSPAELQWSQFEVNDAGQLVIAHEPSTKSDAHAVDHQRNEKSVYLQHAAQLVAWSDDEAAGKLPDPISYDSLSKAIDRRIAALGDGKTSAPTPDSTTKRSKAAPKARPTLRMMAMSVAGACVLGLCVWVAVTALFNGNDDKQVAARTSSQLRGSEATETRTASTAPAAKTAELQLSGDADQELGTLDPVLQSSESPSKLPSAANPLSELTQLPGLSQIADSADLPDAASTTSEMATDDVERNDTTDEVAGSAQDAQSATQDTTIDVTGELEKLAKPAEEESVTTIELAEVDGLKLPALNVAVFPSRQVVSLELPRDIRLRKPELELELRVADGFTVAPSNEVVARPNQGTLWSVGPDDDELSVVVMIAAKLTTGRPPTIRFQISAISPDTPGVVVPLSRDYLERAETLLSGIRNQLTLGIDTIRRSYDSTPKELRSMMTARRKAAEQQLSICEKLFKLATEARRAEGLLDGQFELHGRILETSGEASKVVATFGEPTTMKSDESPTASSPDAKSPLDQ